MRTQRDVIGPRLPGKRYVCSYWQLGYRVLALGSYLGTREQWLVCLWDDGERTRHSTAWSRDDVRANTTEG